MDRLVIRRATPADKQSVLDIRDDVHDGRDYLPWYYDRIMQKKAFIPFVAEIEGKVIAFGTGFLVDDGRTVVCRAARTRPRYSGIGVYKMIYSRIVEESGATKVASILFDNNPAILKDSFRQEHRLVESRPSERYNIKPTDIKLPSDVTVIPTVDEALLTMYVTEDQFRNYLFPVERLVVSWIPIQLKTSNINLLREVGYQLQIISNVRIVDSQVHGVLVFYTKYSCKDTDCYYLDFYGKDILAFRPALMYVLSQIIHTSSEYIDLLITFEENIRVDGGVVDLEEMMKEFGLRKMDWRAVHLGLPYTVQLTYEKDI